MFRAMPVLLCWLMSLSTASPRLVPLSPDVAYGCVTGSVLPTTLRLSVQPTTDVGWFPPPPWQLPDVMSAVWALGHLHRRMRTPVWTCPHRQGPAWPSCGAESRRRADGPLRLSCWGCRSTAQASQVQVLGNSFWPQTREGGCRVLPQTQASLHSGPRGPGQEPGLLWVPDAASVKTLNLGRSPFDLQEAQPAGASRGHPGSPTAGLPGQLRSLH